MSDYVDEDYFKLKSFELNGSFCSNMFSAIILLGFWPILILIFALVQSDMRSYIDWKCVIIVCVILWSFLYFYYYRMIEKLKYKTYNKVDVNVEDKYIILGSKYSKISLNSERQKIYFEDIEHIKTKRINRACKYCPIGGSYRNMFCFCFCIVLKNGEEYRLAISSPDFRILLDKHLEFIKW